MGGRRIDTTGMKFNHWTVLEELGGGKLRVQCDCPAQTVGVRYKKAIVHGESKSCGCAALEYTHDLLGKVFGSWKVIKVAGNGYETCECLNCGKIKDVPRSRLLNGISKSCGCMQGVNMKATMFDMYGEIASQKIKNPREPWQIEAAHDRTKLIDLIDAKFDHKPTAIELAKLLDINRGSSLKIIHDLDVSEFVELYPVRSQYENEIVNFITSLNTGFTIIQNDRRTLEHYELDVYIPDKNIAIEFNGTYWHSSIYKDSAYHQNKSLACMKQGIHLIHIYEYEWKNESKKEKIKLYLKSLITEHPIRGYARECELKRVPNELERQFLDNYHLQGYTSSTIAYGLFYDKNLLSIMTFGVPRFEKTADETAYELIRYCTRPEVTVVGGAERLLYHFIAENKVSRIITYCSLDKFSGSVYKRLGFKPADTPLTKPGYVWVEPDENKVLSRYQTQKHKLVENGLGDESQTEEDIMYSLGYLKVNDAGNMKFIKELQ